MAVLAAFLFVSAVAIAASIAVMCTGRLDSLFPGLFWRPSHACHVSSA